MMNYIVVFLTGLVLGSARPKTSLIASGVLCGLMNIVMLFQSSGVMQFIQQFDWWMATVGGGVFGWIVALLMSSPIVLISDLTGLGMAFIYGAIAGVIGLLIGKKQKWI